MIHVCFGLCDKTGRYSKFTGTTICSIFENTTVDVTVHILHDNTLTADNRDKFIYLAGRYGQAVKFYNVDELCADKIAELTLLFPYTKDSHLTFGAFYRLFMTQILPPDIDKIIYFDSDIIVNLDIKELWQIELGDKILGVIPENWNIGELAQYYSPVAEGLVKQEDYFNSGVLAINLNLLRGEEDNLNATLRSFASDFKHLGFPDQNVLNCCFATRALKLPVKFNRFTNYARHDGETASAGKIYHYVGGSFGCGLGLDFNDSFNRLWINYFVKTPWFDIDSLGRLYKGFLKVRDEQKKSALKLSAIVSGKTRAFVLLEKDIDTLVENFSVRADEEVFAIESTLPLQKLIDVMNASRGKKIFFILLPGFEFDKLEEAGFVRGEDFLDGYDFLPKDKELKKEAYSLVSKM